MSSTTMQSLGEIKQRALAVGAKMWCLYVYFFSCHAVIWQAVRSTGCVVRTIIVLQFMDQFSCGFRHFFRRDHPFRSATQFSFSSLDGTTIFTKLWSKIANSPKMGGKVCVHHFV